MFSKACEYGIRAALFVAQKSLEKERVSLKEIAERIETPTAFTAKILQQLVKDKVLISVKGKMGGFEMDPGQMHTIRLNQIVDSIDGDRIYKGCGLGLKNCDHTKPCPMHDKFLSIRNELQSMLEKTSLLELAKELEEGLTFLKR